MRPGDWACHSCGLNVFASRASCFKCGATRCESKGTASSAAPEACCPAAAGAPTSVGSGEVRFGDWQCPGCGLNVFASKTSCFKCGATKNGSPGKSTKGAASSAASSSRWRVDTESSTEASSDGRPSGADNDSDFSACDMFVESNGEGEAKVSYSRTALMAGRPLCASTCSECAAGNRLHAAWYEKEQESTPQAPQASSARAALPGSPNSWAAAQRLRRMGTSESELGEEGPAVIERRVKSILNKLTPEKFEVLCSKLIECGLCAESHGYMLATVVIGEAVRQHSFSSMYADLCLRLIEHFGELGYILRDSLVEQCWQLFAPEWWKEGATEEGADVEDDGSARKKRLLGSVRFLGELFVRQLLEPYGIITCTNDFLRQPIESDNIELVVAFLTVVGPVFDSPCWPQYPLFRATFWQIRGLTFDQNVAARVRFLLRDLLELRDAGWVDTKLSTKVEKPKRLEDVRWEAAAESMPAGKKGKGKQEQQEWSAGATTMTRMGGDYAATSDASEHAYRNGATPFTELLATAEAAVALEYDGCDYMGEYPLEYPADGYPVDETMTMMPVPLSCH